MQFTSSPLPSASGLPYVRVGLHSWSAETDERMFTYSKPEMNIAIWDVRAATGTQY